MKQCAYLADDDLQYTDGGAAICVDECGGFKDTDAYGDGFIYRYYAMGDYNDGLQCDNDLQTKFTGTSSEDGVSQLDGTAASTFYPYMPVCMKGCCPSGLKAGRGTRVRRSPTSKAPLSVVSYSSRLTFRRAILSRGGLEASTRLLRKARARKPPRRRITPFLPRPLVLARGAR